MPDPSDFGDYEVGRRLRELRRKRHENQDDFARYMGVVVGTYAKYEHATRAPDAVNLIRLHKMTNVDLNWLLTGFESATGPLDFDILKGVIQAIEEETLGIDPVSKARLISRLYSDRIKEKSVGIEANIPSRGKQAT